MDDKIKSELDYAKYMFDRGDSLGTIRTYLKKKIDDEAVIAAMMNALEERVDERVIDPVVRETPFQKYAAIVIGILLILGGISMHFLYRESGMIGTAPLIMFGLGFAAVFGGLKY